MNETKFPKMPKQYYVKKEKSTAKNLRNQQSKEIFQNKQDSLESLELSRVEYSGT